ncbi:MAG TPA: SPW repeat protein [Burkholderiales bacterium]|nr:SPW repeat protein [Burkholderiales bacterium]
MVTTATKRWQDWVNLVLGLWLFVSPWALDYAALQSAAWNAYLVGAAIVVFAAIAAYMPQAWEEMINTVLGIWLVFSPYVLGFASHTMTALHTVVAGVLITAFAVGAMFSDEAFYKRWHDSHMF